jgi:hypothetical protein
MTYVGNYGAGLTMLNVGHFDGLGFTTCPESPHSFWCKRAPNRHDLLQGTGRLSPLEKLALCRLRLRRPFNGPLTE